MAKKTAPKKVRITLKRSGIGYNIKQKNTLKALGFRRLNQTVEHNDNEVLRGMLNKISHLVEIESDVEEK